MLGHLEFDECYAAAVAAAARSPFVAPAEIIRQVAEWRSADQPMSEACRDGNHRDCRVSWCNCVPCHPPAVARLAGPPVGPQAAITSGPRGGPARQLNPADLPQLGRTMP